MPDCTTHHLACDCREAKFAEMEKEIAELKAEPKWTFGESPMDGKWYWVTNGSDVWPAEASSIHMNGWLDYEPFSIIAYTPASVPVPPKEGR